MAKIYITLEVDAKDKLDATAIVTKLIKDKYNINIINIQSTLS